MNNRTVMQWFLLVIAILLLLTLAWVAFSGGVNQLSRSLSFGQSVETIIQFACGFLSLLTIVTCFTIKNVRHIIRILWILSLTTTAFMSSIVWGPPMIAVGLMFSAISLLAALAIVKMLKVGGM